MNNRDPSVIRIALPVYEGKGLNDHVAEHFAHALFFLLVDVKEGRIIETRIMDNRVSDGHGDLPSMLAKLEVNVLICRRIGGRGEEYFSNMDIVVVGNEHESAEEAINNYLSRLKQEFPVEEDDEE